MAKTNTGNTRKQQWDSIWINCNLATMIAANNPEAPAYGAILNAALAVSGEKISWVGPVEDLPDTPENLAAAVHDAGGCWITPGLIDCHSHLVYGGNRSREFELRLEGASYEEIARSGGGIVSTVKATRAASEDGLLETARYRLSRLMQEGVTTVEIKSGYGLNTETELKMLRVARRLGEEAGIRIQTTFLGAHALPPEFKDQPDAYIDLVCSEMLPAAAHEGLCDAVDAFCEGIGFTREQTERVFNKAKELGLPVKLHAEQLSDLGGSELAAQFGALSSDHLEYTSEAGVEALAKSGTVAVILPGAFYFLRETKLPPIELFRRHGVPMAIATDSNPGSSPVSSILLMLNMGCTLFRLTPEEALAGVTRNAAKALGLAGQIGMLKEGFMADFVLWDIETPADLAYRIGDNPIRKTVRSGKIL